MIDRRSARLKRHRRVRKRVAGTPDRPRLAVFRSNRHIYAQLIDDRAARTLASASDDESTQGDKTARAKAAGKLLAERAKSAGIETARGTGAAGSPSCFRSRRSRPRESRA